MTRLIGKSCGPKDACVHDRDPTISQNRIKDEVVSLSTDLSNARAEASRVGDSFIKRSDLEAKARALTQECQELEQQVAFTQPFDCIHYHHCFLPGGLTFSFSFSSSSTHIGCCLAGGATAAECPARGGSGRARGGKAVGSTA